MNKTEENKTKHARLNTQVEPEYYLENGYVVFTERYHLARGYCCGSGCRHCPYKKKSKLGN